MIVLVTHSPCLTGLHAFHHTHPGAAILWTSAYGYILGPLL